MVNKIKSCRSNISGKGLFAQKEIKKGETICFMEGDLIDIDEMIGRIDNGFEKGSDPLGVDHEMYIDLDEPYRSANHSCDPNSFLRGRNELIALKDIKPGEEITFDYSTTMDDNRKKIEDSGGILWTMKCKCGSKNCRKIVDQFRTLPLERQRYYIKNKSAPDFILKKFAIL
ncbi:SET domain protein [uncultured archaeon]|nr:SET domain protein [uncultured archaeon]